MSQSDDIKCLRCQTSMIFEGEKRFYDFEFKIFTPTKYVYLYVCPACAAMQFFDTDMLQKIYDNQPQQPQ